MPRKLSSSWNCWFASPSADPALCQSFEARNCNKFFPYWHLLYSSPWKVMVIYSAFKKCVSAFGDKERTSHLCLQNQHLFFLVRVFYDVSKKGKMNIIEIYFNGPTFLIVFVYGKTYGSKKEQQREGKGREHFNINFLSFSPPIHWPILCEEQKRAKENNNPFALFPYLSPIPKILWPMIA